MVKFRLYFDKDKETKWLNKMAAAGWAMIGFFAGFYKFEQSEKAEYSYRWRTSACAFGIWGLFFKN